MAKLNSHVSAPRPHSSGAARFETIEVAIDGALGRLTLNRPERLNAINTTMLTELIEAARWFNAAPDLRVVIVSGKGRAFSGGADLRGAATPAAPSKRSWLARREAAQLGLRAMDAIEQMRAVTIAQLQGYAVGGAVLLAAACDLRVAADDLSFFIPEIEMGIPLTWGGIPRLVREIGPALTKELVMTCRRFSSEEAKAAGFVNRAVPASRLKNEVEALARQLMAMPSVPVAITKEHVNAVTRAAGVGVTSFADADGLQWAFTEEESRAAARRYAEKAFGKSRQRR